MGIEVTVLATGIGQALTLAIYLVVYFVRPIRVHIRRQYILLSKKMVINLYSIGIPATLNLVLVLKQIHHEPCDYYQFGNKLEAEIRDYKKLKEIGIKMPAMLETDVKNERILKEFIDGDTIYQLVLEDKMKTDYIEQLHKMCVLLYAANTNIDYFPTNFVVHNEEIYYVDFECNDYMEEWNFENWGVKYWSKTPEFLQYVKEHS